MVQGWDLNSLQSGEIIQLLKAGFGYVLQKDDLAYFRKRK
jgi:hypothetical protein